MRPRIAVFVILALSAFAIQADAGWLPWKQFEPSDYFPSPGRWTYRRTRIYPTIQADARNEVRNWLEDLIDDEAGAQAPTTFLKRRDTEIITRQWSDDGPRPILNQMEWVVDGAEPIRFVIATDALGVCSSDPDAPVGELSAKRYLLKAPVKEGAEWFWPAQSFRICNWCTEETAIDAKMRLRIVNANARVSTKSRQNPRGRTYDHCVKVVGTFSVYESDESEYRVTTYVRRWYYAPEVGLVLYRMLEYVTWVGSELQARLLTTGSADVSKMTLHYDMMMTLTAKE